MAFGTHQSGRGGQPLKEDGFLMRPAISVVVSTRNRDEHILPCVVSILENPGSDFEVVVIDQSPADASRLALSGLMSDPRLRYVKSPTTGLSVSRNQGVAEARGAILAFTDDDCRVPTSWVADVRAVFDADAELAMLFGAVLLRREDQAKGFAAEFAPGEHREFQGRFPSMHLPWGIGANMAMRSDVFTRVGTFDSLLGAGAHFHAGEEIDLTIRAIGAGLKVRHTPDISVVHLGLREGADASRLMRGYGMGLGATFAKHVRLGTRGSAAGLAHWLWLHGSRSVRNALRGDEHPGFGLIASVMWGAASSVGYRLDRSNAVFLRPEGDRLTTPAREGG